MKAAVESIAAFLILNIVASSPTYYMYDEKLKAGNGPMIGSTGNIRSHKNNIPKKYFIGSNNQKYKKLVNEGAVDSHFTVEKTPFKPFYVTEDRKNIDNIEVARNLENYRGTKDVSSLSNGELYAGASTKNDVDVTRQESDKTNVLKNQPFNAIQNVYRYRPRDYLLNGGNLHDKKHNFVSVNAHKAAVSKEDRVVVKKANQQLMHQQQVYQHKNPGVDVKDKRVHKIAAHDRNTQLAIPKNTEASDNQISSFNIYGLNHKSVPNIQRMDSKKRDIVYIQPSTSDNTRSTPVSDKIIKYIHKEVTSHKEHKNNDFKHKNNVVSSRIGNREAIMNGMNDTPYALFYRAHPDHLDDQEMLIENPLAEPTNNAYSGKMAWSIENEVQEDSIKTKSKREPNVKIHKKVKNHTSYRHY